MDVLTSSNVALLQDVNSITTSLDKLNNTLTEQLDVYNKHEQNVQSLDTYRKTTVLVYNYEKFISKVGPTYKKTFEDMLARAKDLETFVFIFVDIPNNLKKYEYDPWYKNNVNNTSGIWIGSGVGEQTLIKANIPYRNNFKEMSNDYGVVVHKGKPYLVKLIKKGVEMV